MRQDWVTRARIVLAVALLGAIDGPAGADGLTGFSAYGTASGLGANATTGIPFGPRQRTRRVPVAPRELPPAPPTAIPAAAPPADPVFDARLFDGRPLVEPIALVEPGDPVSPSDASGAAAVPPPAGYGSPALGYGPPVSFAPPPTYGDDVLRLPVPPAEGPPSTATGIPVPGAIPAVVSPGAPPRIDQPVERMPSWDDLPDGPDRRFYLAGILGADFGTLSVGQGPNATDPLFTGGGAAGMAFERPQGWWRCEFEGRYRDPVSSTVSDRSLGGSASVTARDGWSTMINGWRDLEVTDRVAVYLGGGIGGGGYTVDFDGGFPALGIGLSGSTAVTGFAWQAGGGATWLVTERVALDLGYRWYAVDGGPATIDVSTPFFSFSDSVGTNFGASELLFSIRVYEPFRRWGP